MSWHQLSDPENRENRNAGNGGDLVKHTVYLTVLDYFLGQSCWSTGLRVRECHAGRGMYAIPSGDARKPLLECLYTPVGADVGILLHDVQRASQTVLGLWPSDAGALSWYSGSAVLNACRLHASSAGGHLLELYEMAPNTRSILSGVFREVDLRESRVEVRILESAHSQRAFDGELYIQENISTWNAQDLVLLDPFAMWRQNEDQDRRDRYGHIVDSVIERGEESPVLILFWTWGQAFVAADGDLLGTSTTIPNGYQDLRRRLHRAGKHFIRVAWRWELQFAMWIVVPDAHLALMRVALQQQCDGLRDHLLKRGCRGRLASPNIEVVVDCDEEHVERAS